MREKENETTVSSEPFVDSFKTFVPEQLQNIPDHYNPRF